MYILFAENDKDFNVNCFTIEYMVSVYVFHIWYFVLLGDVANLHYMLYI